LTSIRKFMGVYFKPIQTIVDRRAEAIAQEAMKNPDILDLIVKRVGKMDVHQYLLSLSPSELEKVFSPQEKKQIQQSIASLPEARLERIKDIIRSELPRIRFGSVLFGLMVGAAMAALVTSVNRKIKK
ncbi:MAG: hypothetical protein U1C71_02055, partial [archaeon]|nr:hypothetical protein [archaeon]